MLSDWTIYICIYMFMYGYMCVYMCIYTYDIFELFLQNGAPLGDHMHDDDDVYLESYTYEYMYVHVYTHLYKYVYIC
jgi:hypothetical protein